jgi:heme-degrading monooxygenase HmoA
MSYARIVTIHAQAGKLEEVVKVYHESILPAAKQQKGFLDARLFIDRATGKGISVARWQTEEDLKAGEASGYYSEQIAKLVPLLAAPPVREAYEIAVD